MPESQVIARKFRPQSFGEVVGQEAITRTLTNALRGGRVHHAYLFTGARGVGKTTTARILAKGLNCVNGITTEPCGQCASCIEIAESRSLDVQEIDAATYTKVEDTREVIINTIRIAPARDRHKIFIIDEVHMLSTSSFNALLKTLEEPPPNVVFILATTDVHKVPETILSRCQVFEFRTISLGKILDQLRHIADSEGVTVNDRALLAIARAGEGSMRDAESALDQVISFAGSKIEDEDVSAALGLVDLETLNQTVDAIASQDSQRLVRIVDEVVSRGYDLRNFCRELMTHFRGLLMIKIVGFDRELTQMSETDGETLSALAEAFSEQDLLRFFSMLTKTEQDIKQSAQPRFQLEIGLLKLAQAKRLYLIEDALQKLSELESRLGGGEDSRPNQPPTRFQTSAPGATSARGFSSSRQQTSGWTTRKAVAASPVEPADDPFDSDPELKAPPAAPAKSSAISSATDQVHLIKAELEARGKMIVVSALDKGELSIDGDYFKVSYASSDASFKTQIEGRDKRTAIEEACQKVLGRRVSLLVVVGTPQAPEGAARQTAAAKAKPAIEQNPKLRPILDRFHGEVIDVIQPDPPNDFSSGGDT